MDLLELLPTAIFTGVTVGALTFLLVVVFETLLLKPERLRSELRKQGIDGPPPAFLLGNAREFFQMAAPSAAAAPAAQEETQGLSHSSSSSIFSLFDKWTRKYGPIFMFSLGNTVHLFVSSPQTVKEICSSSSLDLGKSTAQQEELAPLLGRGIITSNGAIWAHQRKILAPEFFAQKVKGMTGFMVESATAILNSWRERIEHDGGVTDMKIDECMTNFSGAVISKALFGSDYRKGEEIFSKFMDLENATARRLFTSKMPGTKYLPTKNNRELWRLEREVRALILKAARERREATYEKDLLQVILEAATINRGVSRETIDGFVVDSCKNILLAGYSATTVAASWTLLSLAQNPEWQSRVRAEVLQVCGSRSPDADMLRRMKMLTMVIHETLRLYPSVPIVLRETLESVTLGNNIRAPKGATIWVPIASLHRDRDIWGPNSNCFDPGRFADGVSSACALPHAYMPFGWGPRICLGQNFAVAQLKVLIALVVSDFAFSVSPRYCHAPTLRLALEPRHGVDLLVKKL